MAEPWELTPEEMRKEGEEFAAERAEADRHVAPLFAKQLADDPWPDDPDDGPADDSEPPPSQGAPPGLFGPGHFLPLAPVVKVAMPVLTAVLVAWWVMHSGPCVDDTTAPLPAMSGSGDQGTNGDLGSLGKHIERSLLKPDASILEQPPVVLEVHGALVIGDPVAETAIVPVSVVNHGNAAVTVRLDVEVSPQFHECQTLPPFIFENEDWRAHRILEPGEQWDVPVAFAFVTEGVECDPKIYVALLVQSGGDELPVPRQQSYVPVHISAQKGGGQRLTFQDAVIQFKVHNRLDRPARFGFRPVPNVLAGCPDGMEEGSGRMECSTVLASGDDAAYEMEVDPAKWEDGALLLLDLDGVGISRVFWLARYFILDTRPRGTQCGLVAGILGMDWCGLRPQSVPERKGLPDDMHGKASPIWVIGFRLPYDDNSDVERVWSTVAHPYTGAGALSGLAVDLDNFPEAYDGVVESVRGTWAVVFPGLILEVTRKGPGFFGGGFSAVGSRAAHLGRMWHGGKWLMAEFCELSPSRWRPCVRSEVIDKAWLCDDKSGGCEFRL